MDRLHSAGFLEAMHAKIIRAFPNLNHSNYKITGVRNSRYNCVAWAVGKTGSWWEPVGTRRKGVYWPEGVPSEYSLSAYGQVFRNLGYAPCGNGEPEPGFQKIAIFLKNNKPRHVARQLQSGKWTSKLGIDWRMEHELDGLESRLYGTVGAILIRKIPARL